MVGTSPADHLAMDTSQIEPSSTSQQQRTFSPISTSKDDVLAFSLRGPITAADFQQAATILDNAYKNHQKIGLLVRIVGPMSARLEVFGKKLLQVKLDALRHVERYAIVGGPDWLEGATKLMNPLFRMEVRHFDLDEEEDAWQWLGATPRESR